MMKRNSAVLRETALWIIAGTMGFLVVFYFDQLSDKIKQFQSITSRYDIKHHVPGTETRKNSWENIIAIQANREGHFLTHAKINDEDTLLMVDTGATMIALSYESAEKIGIRVNDSDFSKVARTANGISKVAHVDIDEITIGDITVNNVKAIVVEPGKLDINLLGMNFLSKLKRFEVSGKKLLLVQ